MPFLASKGYETYSISLRGTSGTKYPDIEVRSGFSCLPKCLSTDVSYFEPFVIPYIQCTN